MLASTVVTLDGPVGVGKSTVARLLAHDLGYLYIDTGAMYRAVTLAAMRRGIDLADLDSVGASETALADLARSLTIRLAARSERLEAGELLVFCNDEDVTEAIRSPEVSRNTSPVADVIGVRKEMVRQQRELGVRQNTVMEGRDIATVVFPDAQWKFYLDASIDERTRRRALQLERTGATVDIQSVRDDLIRRDRRDRSRPYGPLRVAPDSIVIDTTMLDERQVVAIIKAILSVTI